MHTIRLRKPWTKSWVPPASQTADKQIAGSHSAYPPPPVGIDRRAEVPDPRPTTPEPPPGPPWRVVYARKFNRPSGIDSATQVWLWVEDWEGELEAIRVNGDPISISGKPLRVEITRSVEPHNRVEVTLLSRTLTPPRLAGEVRLELEEDAIG